jgi:hypothetical protein
MLVVAPTRGGKGRSRRLIASFCWCAVSFGGRPILCPRATARARPSPVRARIRSRSNSALCGAPHKADDAESVVMRSDAAKTHDTPGFPWCSAPHNPTVRRGPHVPAAVP